MLTDFVRFPVDDVIAGPSGTAESLSEAGRAMTQPSTPTVTPELGSVVVPEAVPEPVSRLPDTAPAEPATAHDSDSETTIVAEDYWEAEMRRLRDHVRSQRFSISYGTPVRVSERLRQQTDRPVPQPQDNERSSLLQPQARVIAPNPRVKVPVGLPPTRTAYGTMASSSRTSHVHTSSTRTQSRVVEAERNAGPAYEYARLAPWNGDWELSVPATAALFCAMSLGMMISILGLLCILPFGIDKVLAELVATVVGKVVHAFWAVVDFLIVVGKGFLLLLWIIFIALLSGRYL